MRWPPGARGRTRRRGDGVVIVRTTGHQQAVTGLPVQQLAMGADGRDGAVDQVVHGVGPVQHEGEVLVTTVVRPDRAVRSRDAMAASV